MTWDHPTAFSHWDREEDHAMARVLASRQFTMGPEVEAFEAEFATWHGMRHAIMVNSGSSANLIAVAALFHKENYPLKRGNSVLVPALAWATTYAPLVQYGLELDILDCDATWNASLSHRVDPFLSPRLIVACSVLGNPAPLTDWQALAMRYGAYLIEDNCESFGARTADGYLCGTHGIMNTFSFFYSHQISAIEGGMILTNDDECADLCRMLRSHGWTRGIYAPERFEDEYDFRVMGYNVRPLEIHAAIAREQLKKAEQFQAARWANYVAFRNATVDLPITLPILSGQPNPFGFHFCCERPEWETRDQLVTHLRANGIDCRLPTGGSLRCHSYGEPWDTVETPAADKIHYSGLFLGNAPWDMSERIEKTVAVMRRAFDAIARAA